MSEQPNPRRVIQFDLRDLFFATALIAAGMAGVVAVIRVQDWKNVPLMFMLWHGSGGLIGAGILCPFKQKSIGAIIGYLVIGSGLALYWAIK